MEVFRHPEVIKDILKLFQKRQKGVCYYPYLTGFEPEGNKYSSGLQLFEEENEYFITNTDVQKEINIYSVLENLCFGEDEEQSKKFIKSFKIFLGNYLSENKEFSLPFLFAFYPELKNRKYNLFYYCLQNKDEEQINKDKKFLDELNFEGLEDRIALFRRYYYHFH